MFYNDIDYGLFTHPNQLSETKRYTCLMLNIDCMMKTQKIMD